MNSEPIKTNKRNLLWLWVIIIVLILIIGSFTGWKFFNGKKTPSSSAQSKEQTSDNAAASWQEKGVVIAGQYADAEAVDLGDGKFRMYYSVEPEVPNNNLEIYSSTSTDGITWTKEEGTRKTMATFPDVIKLPDGKWRMYFQNAGVIKSAISNDGLAWTDEPGVRIDKNESGFNLESVGAQSTTHLENGNYLVVYRGTIGEPYKTSEKVPNQNTQLYFWATSKDGLTFEKKGLAIDSKNGTLYGLADGAEWVNWDDGNLRVYFWSYKGVFHSVLENASTDNLQKFSQPVFDFTNNKDTNVKFAPNPPGDPTFLKIKNVWYMYYGQHTKGIYYATLG